MQPGRKDIAEFFRLGLIAGVCRKEDIVRWADSIIISEPSPPYEFFDLSTCGSKPVSTVTKLLANLPGESSPALPFRMLLGHCYRLAESGAIAVNETLVRIDQLFKLESEDGHKDLPDNFYWDVQSLKTELSLAQDGLMFTIDEITRSVVDYFATYKAFAPQPPLMKS